MARRTSGPAGSRIASSGLVLLVGEAQEWPPELEAFIEGAGYATDRRGGLEATLSFVRSASVRAVLVQARPLGASEILSLRRVRESSPGTAIVVVTTTPTNPDLKRAFESGATSFLSWPTSRETLRQAVDSGATRSSGSRQRP